MSFRDSLYDTYVSGHQGILDAARRYPTLHRDVLRRLPDQRSARVLDVGCGSGDLIALLRRSGWTDVSGIDVSREQVRLAVDRGVTGVRRADVHEYAATHPAEYEVILAIDVIEHFDRADVVQLFQGLRRMLTPDGLLILQVPNGASPFSGRVFWSDITHGMQYTHRSLRQVCAASGFSSVTSYASRPAVHGPKSASRAAAWRCVEACLWIASASETGQARGHIFTQNLVAVARNAK